MLERFPVEILRQILNGENSWAAIELWKTGSATLSWKLANRGITEVDLEDNATGSLIRWPQCLSSFKLVRLRVSAPSYSLGEPSTLRRRLKKLHSGLKSLELCTKKLDTTFFGTFPRTGLATDDGAQRPSKRSKTSYDGNTAHTEIWNLNITWPRLERLILSDGSDRSAHQGFPTLPLFALLPRSLTWFEYPYRFIADVRDDLSTLPPRLQTLFLADKIISVSGLLTLPKSITDLGTSLDRSALYALIKDAQLLPSLANVTYNDEHFSFLEGSLLEHGFPPTRHLERRQREGTIEKLPRNLLSLKLDGRPTLVLSLNSIMALPPNLTKLEVSSYALDWKCINKNNWPPTLTHLLYDNPIGLGADCFCRLPRSLTTLHLGALDGHGRTGKLLSTTAARSALRKVGRASLRHEMDVWTKEKARLVSGGALAYAQKIEDGALFGLPLGLTTLVLGHMEFEFLCYGPIIMPPHVTSIQWLAGIITLGDLRLLDGFSPLLNSPLHACLKAEQLCTGIFPTLQTPIKACITSLELDFDKASPAYAMLTRLPRTLRRLKIACKYSGYCDERPQELLALRELSDLTSLSSRKFLRGTSGSWVGLLPPNLTFFEVDKDIKGADFISLPRTLTSLCAPFGRVSYTQLRQLPRGLSKLKTSRKNGATNGCLDGHALEHVMTAYRPHWRIWETEEADMAAAITAGARLRRC